jgi:hypothetical protein
MPYMYAALLMSLPHYSSPMWDLDLKAVEWSSTGSTDRVSAAG